MTVTTNLFSALGHTGRCIKGCVCDCVTGVAGRIHHSISSADHQPVYLARRGRHVAAVIDADDLDVLIELAEDMADIRAAEEARAEMKATSAAPIPWEEVKADLGLT